VLPRPLLIALTIVISLAWIANIVVSYVDPAKAIPAVNTIFGIVAGSLYVIGQKDTALGAIKNLQAKRTKTPKQKDDGGDEA
jgi:hypothetical protein